MICQKVEKQRLAGIHKKYHSGTSLAVQWLRLHMAGGAALLSGQGTKILHVTQHDQNNNRNNLRGRDFFLPTIRSY
jgi:hypothetical protein